MDKLNDANDRLKPLKISLLSRGNRLSVRSTLPNKPGKPTGRSQQTIALNLPCTPSGINRAEKMAVKIANDRDLGLFRWEDYLRTEQPEQPNHLLAIEQFKADYLARGGNPDTWKREYQRFYDRLSELGEDDLKGVVTTTEPHTRNRKRAVTAINALSKFLGLGYDFGEYRGNYSPYRSLVVRDIPKDETIEQVYQSIPNPSWRWVYGMMATFGLRNHEVFRSDLSQWPIVLVGSDTKTGFREVFPCPKRWIEQWDLGKPMPPPLDRKRDNQALGQAVTRQFERYGLPFAPYDLRHAWAIRTLDRGWPLELSAQMMGHGTDVHTKIYQRWITREAKQKIYDRLIND